MLIFYVKIHSAVELLQNTLTICPNDTVETVLEEIYSFVNTVNCVLLRHILFTVAPQKVTVLGNLN